VAADRGRPLNRSLLLLLAAPLLAADPNTLTPAEKAAGWMLLFDGRTTAGWQEVTGLSVPAESWRVEDGCLRALNSGHGYQDLRTETVFSSFEFQFDWKIDPGGNSGVKYLVQKTDRWTNAIGLQARARGFEYQLVDDTTPDAAEPNKKCGSLYGVIAPARAAAHPPGEFNHSLLVVRGTRVEHWLNGVKVVEFDTAEDAPHKVMTDAAGKGPIVRESILSLQNHGTPVWFRSLKVRRLER
jgi:hypothetical protein